MGRSINPRQRPQRGAWRYITLLAILVAISLPSGCAEVKLALAKKAYVGPALPKEEVAVITTGGSVEIAKIDGKDCFNPLLGDRSVFRTVKCEPSAEVLPGQHDIDLEHASLVLVFGLTTPIGDAARTLSFNAEAGHLYLARSDWSSEQAWFWIEDDATGEVVSGTKPPRND